MITNHGHPSADGSALSRVLGRLLPVPATVAEVNPVQRLAELVSFTDSIKLSQRYAGLRSIKRNIAQQGGESASDAFLRVRGSMITSVVRSFDPGSRASRFKLPAYRSPDSEIASRNGSDNAADAYQKFYVAQQRQMELTVQELRNRVRKTASSTSAELARLSALDALLGDVASSHTRACYSTIPSLLREHFECLQRDAAATDAQAEPDGPGSPAFVEQFCDEMRELLLAEIDDRLLPVLGLVEAINQSSDR